MHKKLLALVATGVFAISALTACGAPQTSSEPSKDGTFKLGGLAPLTGALSVYGTSTSNGVKLAIEEINANGGINGEPIDYHLLDEKGDVTEATNAYGRLVSEHQIDALIGDVTSKPSIGVAARADEDGMPMITPTGTADGITQQGKTAFRTCFTDSYQGVVMASYLASQGKKTVAILFDNSDDYSVALSTAFAKEAEAKGIKIVASESFVGTDTDFKAQLTKIVAANPEVLYIPAYYETDALILRQAKETGFKGLFVGGDGWDGVVGQFKDDVQLLDGVLFSSHYSIYDEDETIQKFVKSYQSKYNEDPTAFAALGYDSVYLLKQAVESAGSKDKAKVIDALAGIKFKGITGEFSFDENHNPVKTVSFIEIRDGKYQLYAKQAAE